MSSRPFDPATGCLAVCVGLLSFLAVVVGIPAAVITIARSAGWL